MSVLSENDFLDMAAERDVAPIQELIGFARWFWTSTDGGLARYVEQNPEALSVPLSDCDLASNEALLEAVVDDCLSRCSYDRRILLEPFSVDAIKNAVVLAWEGCFGYLPPLEDDPGYAALERRILARGGHTICPVCRKSAPPDALFCGECGRKLPDMYFFDDNVDFDVARYQLATERKCDVVDVPYEDVVARVPSIEMYTAY